MARKLRITLIAIALTAILGLATSTGASAAVTPLARVAPSNYGLATDGTDIYWLEQDTWRDAKHHIVFGDKLMRGSLLDKSTVLLGKYSDDGDELPEDLVAGGGAVYVNFSNQDTVGDGPLQSSVKVVRISRDGSDRRTVAKVNVVPTGDFVVEDGVPRLSDCWKSVAATSISAAGDVVISQLTSERESKHCGRKKNMDFWRYYELTTGGATREITTAKSRVTAKFKMHGKRVDGVSWGPLSPPFADPWVYYGKAVYQRHHYGEFYIRDLATGAETGPFQTRIPGRDFYATAQVNSLGQLATNATSLTGKKKHEKFNSVSGLFRTPGDPASWAKMKGDAQIEFCGDHLMAVNNRGARELDPVTFALLRTVAPGGDIEGPDVYIAPVCNDHFIYFTRYGPVKTTLLAYPLD